MNPDANRKRLLWFAAIGGVVIVALLFVSQMAPSAHPGENSSLPSIDTEAAGSSARIDEPLTGRPDSLAAQSNQTEESANGGGFSLSGGEAFSLAWRLALAAGIIGISIAGLRWWGKRTQGPRSTTGFIRVIDTLAISNGRTIHLVALGDRVIAVGATAQQLSFLSELTTEEAKDVTTATPPASNGQQLSSFAAELFSSMRKQPQPDYAGRDRTGTDRRETIIGGDR